MPKAFDEWTVLPHDPLQQLEENLWRLEGDLPEMALRRVMTVARMSDGRLVIHNGIALDPPEMAALEALGEPAYVLVPGGYHRLDAPSYRERYPQARVLCPEGSVKKVEQVVTVDGTYDEFPEDAQVSLRHLDGIKRREGVMLVRSKAGATLVLNDAVFNMPHQAGVAGVVFRLMGSTGGPRVSRLFRTLVVSRKRAFRQHLLDLADTPDLKRLIVSHLQMVDDDAAGALRRAANTL